MDHQQPPKKQAKFRAPFCSQERRETRSLHARRTAGDSVIFLACSQPGSCPVTRPTGHSCRTLKHERKTEKKIVCNLLRIYCQRCTSQCLPTSPSGIRRDTVLIRISKETSQREHSHGVRLTEKFAWMTRRQTQTRRTHLSS